jgi:hypothetical protein
MEIELVILGFILIGAAGGYVGYRYGSRIQSEMNPGFSKVKDILSDEIKKM